MQEVKGPLAGQRVVALAAGKTRTAAVTEAGDVYIWEGSPDYSRPQQPLAAQQPLQATAAAGAAAAAAGGGGSATAGAGGVVASSSSSGTSGVLGGGVGGSFSSSGGAKEGKQQGGEQRQQQGVLGGLPSAAAPAAGVGLGSGGGGHRVRVVPTRVPGVKHVVQVRLIDKVNGLANKDYRVV